MNLPPGCELKDVTKVVWGGKVHSINLDSRQGTAIVKFLLPEYASKYFNAVRAEHPDGIPWPADTSRLIDVRRSRKADDSNVTDVFNAGSMVTRCVSVTNLQSKHTDTFVRQVASEGGRLLEHLVLGQDANSGVSRTRYK